MFRKGISFILILLFISSNINFVSATNYGINELNSINNICEDKIYEDIRFYSPYVDYNDESSIINYMNLIVKKQYKKLKELSKNGIVSSSDKSLIIYSSDLSKQSFVLYEQYNNFTKYLIENGVIVDTLNTKENKVFYSPDNKLYYMNKNKETGKYYLVIDGKKQKEYDEISFNIVDTFFENGKYYAYSGKNNGKWVAVLNGIESNKKYEERIFIGGLISGGLRYYTNKENDIVDNSFEIKYPIHNNIKPRVKVKIDIDNKFISVDGVKKYYDFIYTRSISSNGNHYIAYVEKDGKLIILIDGIESKEYDIPNNKTTTFLYNGKKENILRKEGGFIIVKDIHFGYSRISDDGKDTFYKIKENGKEFIIKNGIKGKGYDSIKNIYFLKNGNNIIYIAKENGEEFIVKNLVELKKYGKVNIEKDTNGVFLFTATDNGYVYLLDEGKEIIKSKLNIGESNENFINRVYVNKNGKVFYNLTSLLDYRFPGLLNIEFGSDYSSINFDSIYSLDGEKYGYTTTTGTYNKDMKYYFNYNGAKGKGYDSIYSININGNGYSYNSRLEGKTITIYNGNELDFKSQIKDNSTTSQNGVDNVYKNKTDNSGGWEIILNGKVIDSYEGKSKIKFSNNRLFNNPYFGDFTFSQDGNKLFYVINDGNTGKYSLIKKCINNFTSNNKLDINSDLIEKINETKSKLLKTKYKKQSISIGKLIDNKLSIEKIKKLDLVNKINKIKIKFKNKIDVLLLLDYILYKIELKSLKNK